MLLKEDQSGVGDLRPFMNSYASFGGGMYHYGLYKKMRRLVSRRINKVSERYTFRHGI
jgi:hypothetical protein